MNSFFLIILAPVFAWVWCGWRRAARSRRARPSSARAWCSVGLGFAILIVPARIAEQGTLASPMWLTATYLLHTIGELALSPVGLSAMTRLAPARIGGLMMGVWFLGDVGRQLHRRPRLAVSTSRSRCRRSLGWSRLRDCRRASFLAAFVGPDATTRTAAYDGRHRS